MGKGFNNFMSKKDFHPSAFWNLKKVWEAKQKKELEQKKQDDMRAQYEKEQEILNNKALLGDEKAKMGLSFMYDAPAGINKKEEPMEEPKFEWQRKYNAPREEWAKGNEEIKDQPFGIQVRNVRCVKCHTWGHLNTDNECPLYNMSGNHEEAGFSTNPSDIIKELREARSKQGGDLIASKRTDRDLKGLDEGMKEEYGIALKKHVMDGVNADDAIARMGLPPPEVKEEEEDDEDQAMFRFLETLSEKERSKIFNKFFNPAAEKSSGKKKDKKSKKKKSKKEKKEKKKKRNRSPSPSSESEEEIPTKRRKDVKDERRGRSPPEDPIPRRELKSYQEPKSRSYPERPEERQMDRRNPERSGEPRRDRRSPVRKDPERSGESRRDRRSPDRKDPERSGEERRDRRSPDRRDPPRYSRHSPRPVRPRSRSPQHRRR